jgi:integrase
MFTHIDIRKTADLAHWCSHLTAFYGMFRKSNTVPPAADYDEERVLKVKHFLITDDKVLIFVDFSKVIQFNNRDYIIPVPKNEDPALDLHRHLSELFRRVNASPESPAFSYKKSKFVTYSSFTAMLKKWLEKANLNPDDFTGHSFRRGSATFLHRCGGTVLQIKASGDWASDAFTRYLHLYSSRLSWGR